MHDFDETYVLEILKAIPAGLSLEEFRKRLRPDRRAGYLAEAREAERRYFNNEEDES